MANIIDEKTAFLASSDMLERIEKLRKALGVESTGEVVSMAISLLDIALGREIELKEGNKKLKITRFASSHQTVSINENGSDK